jgi:hypothetical protein
MRQAITTGRPRRRLKKPVRRVLTATVALVIIGIAFLIFRPLSDAPSVIKTGIARIGKYRDINDVHLKYARKNGIAPMKSATAFQKDAGELVKRKKLVRINDSRYYVVNKLSHSHPYLVPEAGELLEIIGKRFHAKLNQHQKDEYLFRITSLLRTLESQKRLRHSNINATTVSAHMFGTTFDISYKNFIRKNLLGKKRVVYDSHAVTLLSETIGELRNERKLVVITEYKEACFHITVCN